MTIEARHLRCFVAIAEEGNVTRAAARLHVSQPALSRTLTQLERDLGVQLVARSTHHLQLSEAGRRFLVAATEALRAFDTALASVAVDLAPLRFGHNWASTLHTAAVIRAWNNAHPEWPLVLRRSEERMAGLSRSDVDVALTRGPVTDPDMRTAQLDSEQRVAVLPAGHRLARRQDIALVELSADTLVVQSSAGVTTPELWPREARPSAIVDTASIDEWLIAIATGTGIGVSVASTATLQPHPDVSYVPLRDAPPVPLLLVWPKQDPHPHVPEFVRVALRATQHLRG